MKYLVCLLVSLQIILSLAFGQTEESFIYDDKGRRDPFLPLVDENGRYLLDTDLFYSSDELKLYGILWDPQGKSSALINDQIVKVGETISGFIIKNINKNSVTLSKNGEDYTIRLLIEEQLNEE